MDLPGRSGVARIEEREHDAEFDGRGEVGDEEGAVSA